MTGYQWLYKGKQVQNTNVADRYNEFKKDGWSIYPDGRDLSEAAPVIAPVVIPIKVAAEPVTPEPPIKEELFKCDSCGKTYKFKMHLAMHKRKHKE